MNTPMAEAKEAVIKAALRLTETGLVARTWGNVSCKTGDGQFVITPSGKAYESLTPADIVVCNISDLKHKGKVKPSTEKGVHGLIYAADENIGFVIHTHQMMATAASVLFTPKKGEVAKMPVSSAYEYLGGGVPVAGYGLPGSKRLKTRVGEAFASCKNSKAILMAHHGALCFGKNCDEAFDAALSLEKACAEYIGVLDFSDEKHTATEDEIGEKTYRQILRAIYTNRKDVKHIKFISDPATVFLSQNHKKVKPLFDDFAQIIGKEVHIVNTPKTLKEVDQLVEALGKNSAVLIRGKGAFCCASSETDVKAIAMILRKGGIALAAGGKFGRIYPLSSFDSMIMRMVYLKKYAKRR